MQYLRNFATIATGRYDLAVSPSSHKRAALGCVIAAALGLMAVIPSASALAPGQDGVRVEIALSGISDKAQAVVVDPNGDIVLAGFSGGNTRLARVMPNGALDVLGFGQSGGIANYDLSVNRGDSLRALVRMSDGHYVGCGVYASAVTGDDFVVARFDSAGGLDTTFNTGVGYVVTPFSASSLVDQCNAVAVQADGMVVSAGFSIVSGHHHVALTRHTALGVPDALFGNGGKLDIDASGVGSDSEARALLIQPDGQLLVAGYALSANDDFLVMRLNAADGSPDMTFGTGGSGIARTPIGTGEDIANAMVLQPDGRIVLAGSTITGGHRKFGLVRYTSVGVPDTSFNGTGKVTTPIGAGDDIAHALLLMPWGRIVAAGETRTSATSSETDLALATYNADGSLDRFFGTAGVRVLSIFDCPGFTCDDIVFGLASDIGGARFWAVGTTAANTPPDQDFLAVEFGLPDTIFRHGFDTVTAP